MRDGVSIISDWLRGSGTSLIDNHGAQALTDFMRSGGDPGKANADAFKALLVLFMKSEPWPATAPDVESVEAVLNLESERRGYLDWLDAWHQLFLRQGNPEVRYVDQSAVEKGGIRPAVK